MCFILYMHTMYVYAICMSVRARVWGCTYMCIYICLKFIVLNIYILLYIYFFASILFYTIFQCSFSFFMSFCLLNNLCYNCIDEKLEQIYQPDCFKTRFFKIFINAKYF